MASIINASTSSGIVQTADTSGVLQLQTNGTTALSISTGQVVNFTNAPTVAGGSFTATTATNLAGGTAGVIPFQTGSGATSFTAAGTTGQPLLSAGTGTPVFGTLSTGAGGTGLTTFTSGGAVYATSTSALTTGTLPIASGGTNSTATPTAGAVPYGTGTAYAFSAVGTSGQVLTSAGSGAPTWSTPSAGALVYLSATTASGVSSIDIETGISSTYDDYIILCDNLTQPSASNTYFYIQYKVGGTYRTSSYKYQLEYTDTTNASQYNEVASGGITNGVKVAAYAYAANSGTFFNVQMNLRSVNTSGSYPIVCTQVTGYSATDRGRDNFSYGLTEAATGTLSGIRFLTASGTISGVFKLYGIAKS